MASTSVSSIQKSFKYDVFLSFRGEDTRKKFVDHLYHALKQQHIKTYKDDEEIKKGKRISDELIGSIEDSRVYIIVFSKNYASSSWCLDELVKIMECHNKNEQTAYPIFYDVEPTEVRNQSGAVGEAFAKHVNAEAAESWRDALKEAASLAGRELKNTFDGHEAKFIQKIVEEISLELRFCNSSVDGKLVGMDKRIKDVVSSLEIDIEDVRIIGIKGMGGVGKTTLARAIFDHISIWFEGSSFVENVRETSKNPLCGIKSLQKQVLLDVLNKKDITVNGVYEGKRMMKQRICSRKVLVVLDDVDHINQLEALAGEPSWFKSGSRIIITTRDEHVLVAHRVNLILDVSFLSYEEAICLFLRHAFGREIPQGYKKLADQFVSYAAGLPLTIKVLGSFLCGKDELEWTDALERLKTIPLKETLEILELSYESLEEDHKEIFLDVACVLKGWEKEKAIFALESCGFHARSGLKVLEQKSLITLSISGCLGMHDHIEEMGKNIVRRFYPKEPYRHSRLWIKEEVEDILVDDKGTKATRCLKLHVDVDPFILMNGLKKMKELRFLEVICRRKVELISDFDAGTDIDYHDIQYLPNSLQYMHWDGYPFICLPKRFQAQYMHWDGYPFICLPKRFQANNLVSLKLSHSNIDQLWEGGEKKVLKKLRFINLHHCSFRTFDIELIPNLERLNLTECWHLEELHMPVKSFKLKYLMLRNSKLRTLDLVGAKNLNNLIVQCECLVALHMPVESVDLIYLSLQCGKLKTLNLTRTPNLKMLYINGRKDLVELHMPIENFKLEDLFLKCCKLRNLNLTSTSNLKMLYVSECEDLVELYLPTESLKLESLSIRCCKLKTLNLTWTPNLETLIIEECEDLVELHMPIESFKLRLLNLCHSKLRVLDLARAQNLRTLKVEKCEDLVALHMPVESVELGLLKLCCSKLRALDLASAQNLQTLKVKNCMDLVELRMPVESFQLGLLKLCCIKMRALDLTRSQNLHTLKVEKCDDLVELHMPVENFKLKNLFLECCKLKTLNLSCTPDLEMLYVRECEDLLELRIPAECFKLKLLNLCCSKLKTLDLTHTQNLHTLKVEKCGDLIELHMPLEYLKLKSLSLQYCFKLKTIINLELTPNLEQLDVEDCYNLVEIQAPVGCLKHLVHIKLGGCVRYKPFLVNPRFPDFGFSAELHLIARSLDICPLHPDNSLPKFQFECIYKERLPSSIGNLEKLLSFGLCACTNLVRFSESICSLQCLRKLTLEGSILEVPKEIDRLECLEELALLSTYIKHFPDSNCMLKHLKVLRLKSCWLLEQLPENLGRLECLEELHLTECVSLRHIPNSVCEMKRLKCFHLTYCVLVEKLPEEIGGLKCLEELNIEGTGISHLPLSIFQLKGLLIIGSTWRLESYGFTTLLEKSNYTSCCYI